MYSIRNHIFIFIDNMNTFCHIYTLSFLRICAYTFIDPYKQLFLPFYVRLSCACAQRLSSYPQEYRRRKDNYQPIPASGFVLCPVGTCDAKPGDSVSYPGMEEVIFGIQVGNSIVRNGVKTERFLSRFYNIRHLEPVPFPPSLYPMNFKGGRAARIALGADAQGKPMLLWAEGAPKLGYLPGTHSRGASLSDMADICTDVGMVNAVNLDGGGSAQMLLNNQRFLEISDRNPDHSESERPVPNALIIR